jgi:hypothetical protein
MSVSWRLLLVGCLLAGPAAAQQGQSAQPLRKTDLVRLLTSGSTTKRDIAAQVRRNCLTFQPSARDRADLQASGADSAIFNAIAACALPAGTLRIALPRNVLAVAGSEATLEARVLRWDVPQPGVSLLLLGARGIPGGPEQDPGATTDSTGTARFRFSAGLQPGVYRLTVVAASGLRLRALVALTIMAAPEWRAQVVPTEVVQRAGGRVGAEVRVTVTGGEQMPARGVTLDLAGISAELVGVAPVTTDARGIALFTIPAGAVRRGGTVGVFASGQRLGSFTLRLETVVLSPERTKFIGGTEQRGTVGTPLRAPLVFEVRDTSGAPVPGFAVTFETTSGGIAPAIGTTESNGVVRATLTLGDRAGSVVVTATAGAVRRQATLAAVPGPPQQLQVERGGTPVTGTLSLATRDSVPLRVVARDAYGNDARLTGLAVLVDGGAIRVLRPPGAAGPGTVVIAPRKSGTAALAINGSGLGISLPVEVMLPAIVTGPWVFGARAGGAMFSYGFPQISSIDGRPGFRAELLAGRAVRPGFRLEAGLGFGVLGAEMGPASLAVGLFQGLVRGEFTLLPSATVHPVLSLGGGLYRIKSTDAGNAVYHTSLLWLIGVGADYPLSPRLTGEVRLERQQLLEANSKYANGAVGALTVFEVGVRITR